MYWVSTHYLRFLYHLTLVCAVTLLLLHTVFSFRVTAERLLNLSPPYTTIR